MVSTGQLSTEYLLATQAREQARKERNEQQNKIVQKYGEIYGHQARRQIAEDEEEERQVINMREQRVKKHQEKEEAAAARAVARANNQINQTFKLNPFLFVLNTQLFLNMSLNRVALWKSAYC